MDKLGLAMSEYKTGLWAQLHKNILNGVLWPDSVLNCSPKELMSQRKREVNLRGFGLKGSVYSPKLRRQVPFESMNECKFLNMLEKMEEVVWYQEQPLVIPYEWKGKETLYYPDFCVGLADGRYFIAEVKELFEVLQHQNAEKLRALWSFCLENGLGLLVIDGTKTIQEICGRSVDLELKQALLEELHLRGQIGQDAFGLLEARFPGVWDQLPAIVLEERLVWQAKPFVLKMPENESHKTLQ